MGRRSKTTGKKIGKKSTLGKALMKAKKKQRLVRVGNARCSEMHIADVAPEGSEGKLQSVIERNALDEFLANAVMAGREFSAERDSTLRVLDGPISAEVVEVGSRSVESWDPARFEQLRIPKRPKWDRTMTAEQVDRQEKDAFLDWRRGLARAEEGSKDAITPFEKNLEVWRQLWRVVERSDVVVQIVDSRNPMLFRCADLEGYVGEIAERQGRSKRHILVINKADFLPRRARAAWAAYLDRRGIPFVFWSAWAAQKEIDQASADSSAAAKQARVRRRGQTLVVGGEGVDAAPVVQPAQVPAALEMSSDKLRVLSREELLDYLESTAQVVRGCGGGDAKKQNAPGDKKVVIGMIGYPNVGKSSTINVLMGEKKVSVSSTPGKTKHFQTLRVREGLELCDCPGLVFPTFMRTKAALVAAGVFPIAQVRDYTDCVAEVVSRVTRGQLLSAYGLQFPGNRPVTASDLLDAHALMRGFMKDHGRPDASRSARIIMSDFVDGRLLFCHPPPGVSPEQRAEFIVAVQGPALAARTRQPGAGAAVRRKREVWGVAVGRGQAAPVGEAPDVKKTQKGPDTKRLSEDGGSGGDVKSRPEATAGAAAAAQTPTQAPVAAGLRLSSGGGDDDEGLMEEFLEEEGVSRGDDGKRVKPNTVGKMSKRERRRLRKLNKMGNKSRRAQLKGIKRQITAGKKGIALTASQRQTGGVVAVTWGASA